MKASALHTILILTKKYARLIVGVLGCAAIVVSLEHTFFPSFQSSSKLNIKTRETSQLLTTAAKISGYDYNSYSQYDQADKYLKMLTTHQYFIALGKAIRESDQYKLFLAVDDLARTPRYKRLFKGSFNQVQKGKKHVTKYSDYEIGSTASSWVSFSKNDYDSILVSVVMPNKEMAVHLNNIASQVAVDSLTAYEKKEIQEVEEFLENELNLLENKIRKFSREAIELHIRAGSRSNGQINREQVELQAFELRKEIQAVRTDITEMNSLKDRLGQQVSALKRERQPASYLEELKSTILGQRSQLNEEIRLLNIRKNALESSLQGILELPVADIEQEIKTVQQKIDLNHTLFEGLKKQLFDMKIYKISLNNKVRIYDKASLSFATIQVPLRSKLLLSFAFVVLLLAGLIYTLEYINPTVRSKADIEKMGIFFAGEIPQIGKRSNFIRTIKSQSNQDESILCNFDVNNVVTTAFRYIRTRILQRVELSQGKEIKVMSIVSPSRGEGKSIVSANLAGSLGKIGKKTLIVDCDVKLFNNTHIYGIRNEVGLTEILSGEKTVKEVLITGIQSGVDFIPSGKLGISGVEYISSERFGEFIRSMREIYDFIILETAAYDSGPEAIIATRSADVPVIVTSKFETGMSDLEKLMDGLSALDFKIVFGVLNRVDESELSSFGYGYLENRSA